MEQRVSQKIPFQNVDCTRYEKCAKQVPVAIIIGIILFIYCVLVIFASIFMILKLTVSGIIFGTISLIVAQFILATTLSSFLRAMLKNPGYITEEELRELNLNDLQQEDLKNHPSGATWCVKCNQAKPPRAHHCSTCRRCVMIMDHHCVFVNNCVGAWNHMYFVSFLFWMMIACFVVLILTLIKLGISGDFTNWSTPFQKVSNILLFVCIIFALYGSCITSSFFSNHFMLYTKGTTTIETKFQRDQELIQKRKGVDKYGWINPFC